MTLRLWSIARIGAADYDTYDSAVVVAATADDARHCHPDGPDWKWDGRRWVQGSPPWDWTDDTWVPPGSVTASCVGTAATGLEAGHVVCASFNAG